MLEAQSHLLRFRFGLAGKVSAPAHRSIICLVPSVTIALAWRFDSAVARPRAEPMAAFAPLSHVLMNGFFLVQGFFMALLQGQVGVA